MNSARFPYVARGERDERPNVEAAGRALPLIHQLKLDALHEWHHSIQIDEVGRRMEPAETSYSRRIRLPQATAAGTRSSGRDHREPDDPAREEEQENHGDERYERVHDSDR